MKNFITILQNNSIRRLLSTIFILSFSKIRVFKYKILFSNCDVHQRNTKILQATQFIGRGLVTLNNVQLGVWPSPGLLSSLGYIEARRLGSAVTINSSTVINNNFSIIADKSFILIGSRCLIGPNVFITDSDFHSLNKSSRNDGLHVCKPVIIGDDVFVGEGTKILKGVHVGNGSVIASGSLVVNDVEANCLYAGVPAKKIREL